MSGCSLRFQGLGFKSTCSFNFFVFLVSPFVNFFLPFYGTVIQYVH